MNVLLISNDPSIFSPESSARARLQTYASAVGALHVISRARPPHVAQYRKGIQEGGLVLHAVSGGKLLSLIALLFRARTLVRSEAIEVVSAQDPFEYGWIAQHVVQGTSAKLHIQVHTDFCSPWFIRDRNMRAARVHMSTWNTLRVRIADRVLPHANAIRAVSVRVKDGLEKRYGNRIPAVSVIPIASPIEISQPTKLPPHEFNFALLTASRLEPEKRIEDLIDAVARLHRTYPTLGLFVVGEGRSRKRLERRAASLGLKERVIFLGYRADVQGLMRSAQAYVQASAYEGYGLTLIEAALARCPIITTDVGVVGEVFIGYEDVLVAPPGDPAALATHMAGLIEDVQSRRMLTMHAEAKARKHLATLVDQPARIAADLARTVPLTS